MKKIIIALSIAITSSFAISALAQNPVEGETVKKECSKEGKECCKNKEKGGKKEGMQKRGEKSKKDGEFKKGDKKFAKGGKKYMMKRGGEGCKANCKEIFAEMNLTPEQKAKVEKLMSQNHEKTEKVRNKADKDMKKNRESIKKELKKILTPEQFAQFEAQMKDRKHHEKEFGKMESKRQRGEQLKVTPAPGK